MKPLTKEEFIEKARQIHGDKYDYSKVEYVNNHTKVCIICPKHGEFWMTPADFLQGHGCSKCVVDSRKYTLQHFIDEAKKIHGDKYDYSKVKYTSSKVKVCIICPKHGEFYITPRLHLQGYGCNKCLNEKKKNKHLFDFIEKAKQVHDGKYDYSKVVYINSQSKVCVICPIHGEFWQTPSAHLRGQGCPICGIEKLEKIKSLTNSYFKEKATKIHKGWYDYSLTDVENRNADGKVKIICPIHGEFWQLPNNHLQGMGCKKCAKNETHTTEEIIDSFKKIHGDKYDYSKVKYVNARTKVCIICPIHGEFWQTPSRHLMGQSCPFCVNSKLEDEIKAYLDENKIEYVWRYRTAQLGRQSLDFFIPSKNIAIECQGIQHFKVIDHFGGNAEFEKIVERDDRKRRICEKNGIKLLYYSNLGIDYPYQVYEDKEELLKEILK